MVGAPILQQGDDWIIQMDQDLATAGISEATGEVVWRERGTMAYCSAWLDEPVDPESPGPDAVPVRCRATGRIIAHAHTAATVDALTMALEGFEPATGKTTWAVDLGAVDVQNEPFSPQVPALAGRARVTVISGGGPLVVDLVTGANRRPDAGEAFWCRDRAFFEYKEPFAYGDGRTTPYRSGGLIAKACTGTRDATTALPSWDATRAVGASLGEIVVVANANGFAGYRAG